MIQSTGDVTTSPKDFSNRFKLSVFFGLAAIFIVMGLFTTPSMASLKKSIMVILTHPSRINFDSFFWTGEFGAPFVQAGLCMIMVLIIYWVTGTNISGSQVAAFGMVTGFAFYGKNILNMWFVMAGVFLHAIIFKKKLADVTPLAFFLSCLTPFFSFHAFGQEKLGIGSPKAIFVGAVIAIAVSFSAAVFAEYFPKIHGGYLLFNAGLAGGWAATMMASFLKAIGLGMENPDYGDSYLAGANLKLSIMLAIPLIYLIVVGLLTGGLEGFKKLFWFRSKGENHVKLFGFAACLINMGVLGLISIAFILIVGGQLNGVLFTCIWATIAFSANGSTIRTQIPVAIGIMLGAFFTSGAMAVITGNGSFFAAGLTRLSSRDTILCVLFSCGVAPIVGSFGVIAGILVGLVHIVIVSNFPTLHGWMLLYNNGFSLGFVTILLYPVYSRWFIKHDDTPSIPAGAPK